MINKKIDKIIEFIEQRDTWDLSKLIYDTANETELLKFEDINYCVDEFLLTLDTDIIIGLDEFLDVYTKLILSKTCLMLNSFKE